MVKNGKTIAIATIIIVALLLCSYLLIAALGNGNSGVKKSPGVVANGLAVAGTLGTSASDDPAATTTSDGNNTGQSDPTISVWNAPDGLGGMTEYYNNKGVSSSDIDTMYNSYITQGKTPSAATDAVVAWLGTQNALDYSLTGDVSVSVTNP